MTSSVIPVTVPVEMQRALGASGAARCAVELRPNLVVLGALSPSTGVFAYSVFAVPEDDAASGRGGDALAPNSAPVVTGAVALAPPQPDHHAYELVAAIPWTGHVLLLVRNRAIETAAIGVFSLDARNGTVLALGALSLHQRSSHLAVAATGAGDLVLVEALPLVATAAAADGSSQAWDVARGGAGTASAATTSSMTQPLYVRVFAAAPLIAGARFAKDTSVAHGWAALPALASPVEQALPVASPLAGALLRQLHLVRNTRASFRIVTSMLVTDVPVALTLSPDAAPSSGPSTVQVDVATVHVIPSGDDDAPTLSMTPVAQPPASPPILSPASPAANAPPLALRAAIPAPGRVEDPTPTNTDVTVADVTVVRDANGFDAVEECSICFCPFELTAPPVCCAAASHGDADASQTAPPTDDGDCLAGDATVTLLACGHQFHYECLRMALARAGSFKQKGQYIRFGGLKCPMGCGALVREAALCPELEPWHALLAVVGKLAVAEDEKIATAAAAAASSVKPTNGGNTTTADPPIEGLSVSSPLQVTETAAPSPAASTDDATSAATKTANAAPTADATAALDAAKHETTEERLKRHLFYLCHKCDQPFPGGPYDCQATLNDPECSPAALICDRCLDDFACSSHGRACVVYKCARCWGRATRRFMGRQFMCEACLAEKGKPLPPAAVSAAVVPTGAAADAAAAKHASPPTGSAFAAVPLAEFAVVGHDDAGMGSSVVGCGVCRPALLHC